MAASMAERSGLASANWTVGAPATAGEPGGEPTPVASLLRGALLAVLVFALAYGAVALTRVYGRTASVWLANAVIVGLVIRAPRRQWPALLAVAFGANITANLANHDPVLRATLLSLINIIESTLVILLMGRRFTATSRFDDGHVIARFLLYAGGVGPFCAALLAAASLTLINGLDFGTTLIHWYVADALGMLTLGALLLAAPTSFVATARGAWIDSIMCVMLAGSVTLIAFGQGDAPLLFTVAPVLMIATLRAPLMGAMAASTACIAIALGATLSGAGPIANADIDPALRIYVLQGFVASLLFVVLPVRALVGERDRLGGVIARSERLFSRIAEASPAGTIHFDPLGQPTFANQRWTDLTGIARDDLSGDHWLEAIDPADRGAARSLWSRARATLEPCSGEYRFVARGVAAGHADLHVHPEVEDGRILGFVVRLTDVTGRRLAEDALQQREALYRLVTENAQDVIVRLGMDGCPIYVSGAALRVTGFAPSELVGRPLSRLIHPDDLAIFGRTLDQLAAGSPDAAVEFRLRHRDGHYSWIESSQRPLFDRRGAPIELVASLRDINLRRQSEAVAAVAAAKLRETNRLLLLAEGLAGVGNWQYDVREGEFDYSPQINRILGRERADRIRIDDILVLVHRDDRRPLLACLARARRRPGSSECALRIHASDGVRHVRLVAQAEHDGGAFAGWVGVARDVTETVKADTALIQARDEARAAAEAKSNFLATMSHEIRTPMTGVLGMIDLLRSEPAAAERDRYYVTLKQSANLLMTVLDDILDYSKFESGKLELESAAFSFEELSHSTLDLFGNAASQKGLLLSMQCECPPGAIVRGDRVRVQQVISNLINNAIKFTECGRITITVRAGELEDERRNWRVEVSDTGIGIDPAQLDSLFQPFVQAETSTSRRFGGTGLGLAISRRLVDAMDGTMGVISEPGAGSTFWFEIPLVEGATTDWHAPPSALHTAGRSLRILVAEDNAVNQMLIEAMLGLLGHRALLVMNGRLAVDAANGERFDCILMDMQMPEMDGMAATRAIRASGGPNADTPIIALTGDASPDRRRFYDNCGLTDFMTKPIDRLALAARLAAIAGPKEQDPAALPVEASDIQLLDTTNINQLCAAIGSTRFDGLLDLLEIELTERPATIRLAVASHDVVRARREAHSLKGAALSVGAMALGQAAAMVELAPDVAAVAAALPTLDRQVARTRQAIEALIPRTLPARDSA